MVGQRDPARYGMAVVVCVMEFVVGVLLAVAHGDEPFFLVVGPLLAVIALVLVVVSTRRLRRERRRVD